LNFKEGPHNVENRFYGSDLENFFKKEESALNASDFKFEPNFNSPLYVDFDLNYSLDEPAHSRFKNDEVFFNMLLKNEGFCNFLLSGEAGNIDFSVLLSFFLLDPFFNLSPEKTDEASSVFSGPEDNEIKNTLFYGVEFDKEKSNLIFLNFLNLIQKYVNELENSNLGLRQELGLSAYLETDYFGFVTGVNSLIVTIVGLNKARIGDKVYFL
jgi:hypothetical protein